MFNNQIFANSVLYFTNVQGHTFASNCWVDYNGQHITLNSKYSLEPSLAVRVIKISSDFVIAVKLVDNVSSSDKKYPAVLHAQQLIIWGNNYMVLCVLLSLLLSMSIYNYGAAKITLRLRNQTEYAKWQKYRSNT